MEMDMITVAVVGALHFSVTAPCGRGWSGMRHSDDVRIVLDRAMDHPKTCEDCAKKREKSAVSRENEAGSSGTRR
jgi:hypothetical protein